MNDASNTAVRDGRTPLCYRAEIGDAGKGLSVRGLNTKYPEREVEIFLINDGDDVRCYLNLCPHQGTPLDIKPDTFLDYDRAYIQCTTHAAKFRKHDGMCIDGPCVGRALIPVSILISEDGAILLGDGDPFRPGA